MAGRQVTPALYGHPAAGSPVLISAPEYAKHRLMAEVARREGAGELVRIDRAAFWDAESGRWRIRVRRMAPPPPRWRRPAATAGAVLAVFTALVSAGWWAMTTLAALPGLVALVLVLVLFVAFTLRATSSDRTTVTVTVEVER